MYNDEVMSLASLQMNLNAVTVNPARVLMHGMTWVDGESIQSQKALV